MFFMNTRYYRGATMIPCSFSVGTQSIKWRHRITKSTNLVFSQHFINLRTGNFDAMASMVPFDLRVPYRVSEKAHELIASVMLSSLC